MHRHLKYAILAITSVLVSIGGTTLAEVAVVRDSATFDWKYEMDLLPDAEDLDGDQVPDWIAFGNPWSLTGMGTATYSSTESQISGYETIDIYNLDVQPKAGNVEGHWLDGYTYEFRVKVPESYNDRGSFGTANSVVGGKGSKMAVSSSDTKLGSGYSIVDGAINSDDFHVFRVAQEGFPGNGRISAWRDGIPIAVEVSADFNHSLTFLDIGSSVILVGT